MPKIRFYGPNAANRTAGMFSRARRRERPSLAELATALRPVLEVGLPIKDSEAEISVSALAAALGWQRRDQYRRDANDLLRRALQDFADDDLAAAARALFGDDKPSLASLAKRRSAAAEIMRVDADRFHRDFESSILSTLAYQILRTVWPQSDQKPEAEKHPTLAPILYFLSACLLLFACLTITVHTSLLHFHSTTFWRSLAAGLGCLAALGAMPAARRARRSNDRTRERKQISPFPDPEFLVQCQREAASRLANSKEAVPLLVDMILSPSQYRMRTAESISLEGRNIRQQVSIDFSFSDNRELLPNDGDQPQATAGTPKTGVNIATRAESPTPPQFLYVPLLVPKKGILVDRLAISRSDGSSAISLSYKQALRVLSLGLRYLILSALSELGHPRPDLNNSKFEAASLELLRLIARRGPIEKSSSAWASIERIVDATLNLIADLFPRPDDLDVEEVQRERAAALKQVRDYVLMLTHSYPIIVSLPNTDTQLRRRLRFERIIESRPRAISRLRLWLGLRPNKTEIPINLAFMTDSYHLEVVGPPEYYVDRQFVGCGKCDRRLRSEWRGVRYDADGCHHAPIGLDDQCYVRVRSRLGQNYAHAYMRGLAASRIEDDDIVARVRFAEAPPGVEERALFSSLTASVVFFVMGLVLSRRAGAQIPTDVPSLFLAVPGFAAAWFGFSSDADTVLRSSMTARVSLVVTALLSLAGVSLYLLQHYLGWTARFRWDFLGIHQDMWLSLLGISLVNFWIVGYKVIYRMAQFVWLSTRARTDVREVWDPVTTREEIHENLALEKA